MEANNLFSSELQEKSEKNSVLKEKLSNTVVPYKHFIASEPTFIKTFGAMFNVLQVLDFLQTATGYYGVYRLGAEHMHSQLNKASLNTVRKSLAYLVLHRFLIPIAVPTTKTNEKTGKKIKTIVYEYRINYNPAIWNSINKFRANDLYDYVIENQIFTTKRAIMHMKQVESILFHDYPEESLEPVYPVSEPNEAMTNLQNLVPAFDVETPKSYFEPSKPQNGPQTNLQNLVAELDNTNLYNLNKREQYNLEDSPAALVRPSLGMEAVTGNEGHSLHEDSKIQNAAVEKGVGFSSEAVLGKQSEPSAEIAVMVDRDAKGESTVVESQTPVRNAIESELENLYQFAVEKEESRPKPIEVVKNNVTQFKPKEELPTKRKKISSHNRLECIADCHDQLTGEAKSDIEKIIAVANTLCSLEKIPLNRRDRAEELRECFITTYYNWWHRKVTQTKIQIEDLINHLEKIIFKTMLSGMTTEHLKIMCEAYFTTCDKFIERTYYYSVKGFLGQFDIMKAKVINLLEVERHHNDYMVFQS